MGEISVQVCYALPDRQFLKALRVQEGMTLRRAIELSDLLQVVPEIDIDTARVGIYGKLKTLDTVLRDHDRVEVYRPLIADPKDARRRRAGKKAREA
ncbi:RnfH family protein [Noviherbaspirillum aerium]|uniref:RnfH family protein n=1 Tax=Noviherbaspirillum aerium TaxID=2588497 RepID=UPI00124DCA9D|nr:RnfH family protein [Noviherbaspirillum aerium]